MVPRRYQQGWEQLIQAYRAKLRRLRHFAEAPNLPSTFSIARNVYWPPSGRRPSSNKLQNNLWTKTAPERVAPRDESQLLVVPFPLLLVPFRSWLYLFHRLRLDAGLGRIAVAVSRRRNAFVVGSALLA